jgi:hypothetical protein
MLFDSPDVIDIAIVWVRASKEMRASGESGGGGRTQARYAEVTERKKSDKCRRGED